MRDFTLTSLGMSPASLSRLSIKLAYLPFIIAVLAASLTMANEEWHIEARTSLRLTGPGVLKPAALAMERDASDASAAGASKSSSRKKHGFLGPTPKEREAECRARMKNSCPTLLHKEPGSSHLGSGSAVGTASLVPSSSSRSSPAGAAALPKAVSTCASTSDSASETTFWTRVGDVPLALGRGKGKKLANITLVPEAKQVFHGKVIYFFPNDDINAVRRQRIHKVIEYGAAWVKRWRSDVSHIIVEDDNRTYLQLLKHLNLSCLPVNAVWVIIPCTLIDVSDTWLWSNTSPTYQIVSNSANSFILVMNASSSRELQSLTSQSVRVRRRNAPSHCHTLDSAAYSSNRQSNETTFLQIVPRMHIRLQPQI